MIETKTITRTALMLALTIIFQGIGRFIPLGPNNNFVVGPLVNACLFITTVMVGFWGAAFIAVAAPYGAMLTGAAVPLLFSPFIALGNLVLVLLFYLLMKRSFTMGVAVASVIKFLTLYASIILFVNLAGIPAKKATALLFSFGWPQLITALIGGAIAMTVIKLIKPMRTGATTYDK